MALNTPTSPHDRIDLLDSTRGFALLGIFFINILAFAKPGSLPFFSVDQLPADRAVMALIMVFVESKFFPLFALMFGMGFALQWLRSQRKETDFVAFFRRRLFFLGIFGLLHLIFLWESDILLIFAVVGLLQIPFRNLSPQKLLRWIIGLLGVMLILYAIIFSVLVVAHLLPAAAPQIALVDTQIVQTFTETARQTAALYATGSYAELLQARLGNLFGTTVLLATRTPTVLAMFLLGLYCGKIGLITNLSAHVPLLRRVRLIGLTAGFSVAGLVGVATLAGPPTVIFSAAFFNQALAGPLVAVGYGASFALFALNPANRRLTTPLAAYGRMALTNYLLQSAVATTLFYGYGFGLIGEVSRLGTLGIAVVIHLALITLSLVWLRTFRFGPMEWVWRSLTYKRLERARHF